MRGPPAIGPRALAMFGAVAVLVLMILTGAARAERSDPNTNVAALTKQLESKSDKTRLAAVLALAKLGEPSVTRPLMTALRDPSARVRAVAATALGRLEYAAALPVLRSLAADDRDPEVRKAAATAELKLASARTRVSPAPAGGDVEARRAAPAAGRGLERPAGERGPDLYLSINSSADESPGSTDKATRQIHADIIKRELFSQLRSEPSITTALRDAQRFNLQARHVDLSVTRLELRRAGPVLELAAELRIAISDDNGKMLSFLNGGAKVQVPSGKFDTRYLPALRREALENAMRGMLHKLLAHLRDQT